jgi:DNA-binding response OmpR family regulator
VLVVDDEPLYCDKLALFLARQGYVVSTAQTGDDAIRLGAASAPDLVITDWMLSGHIHGLHVVDAIRAVHPSTRTIVMTGYSSEDLRFEAEVADVSAFIEKPFAPDLLATAVALALDTPAPRAPYPVLAFVVTDADGAVTMITKAAQELLGVAPRDAEGIPLRQLFGRGQPLILDHATTRWVSGLRPAARPELRCVARARRLLDGRYFVVLGSGQDAPLLNTHPSVQLVLDTGTHTVAWLELSGHGLVVDPDVSARSLVVCVFEQLGAICHSVDTLTRALDLLGRDDDIRYVIVDASVVGDVREFARLAAHRRPDITVVGQGEMNDIKRLADAGIYRRITKPWSVSEFLGALVEEPAMRSETCAAAAS